MRHLCRRATEQEGWNQPEREVCFKQQIPKGGVIYAFDIRHGTTGFGIVPAGFLSCFGPVFPHTVSIIPFWNSNVYSTILQVGSM